MKILLILLFIINFSFAEDKYSIRIGYGIAQKTNLGDIVVGDWKSYEEKTEVINLDIGYKINSITVFDSLIDFYIKGGLSYFNEHNSFLEATVYFKGYWNIDFLSNKFRLGIGEGLSFASDLPMVEYYDADYGNEPTSKVLNYLDISFDVELGSLLSIPSLNDTYIGYTIKHRSGVFGLFNGVHGGSNYNMITIEKKF